MRYRKELYILILFVVLCLLVKSDKTFDDTQTIRHILWAIFTLVLFVSVILKERIRICGIFWVFAFFIIFSILSLSKAISFTSGFYEVLKLFLMMVFLYTSAKAIRDDKELFFKAMVLISLFVGIYGVYSYFTIEKIYQLIGLMSNRNQWSALNLLLLPFCFTPPFKKLRIVATSLLIFNIITLCTRSVWVALMFASIVTVVSFKLLPKLRYIVIGVLAVVVSVVVANYQIRFFHRAISTESIYVRTQKWSKTIKMVRDNPFLGVGIGNWPVSVPAYGNNYVRDGGTNETFWIRAHNGFLSAFSETGIAGGIAYLSIFIFGLYYARFYPAMFFGILCYMGFAFFSFPKERAILSVLVLLMIAVVLPLGKPLGERASVLIYLSLTVILSWSLLDFCARYKSESYTKRMVIAKESENWQKIINLFDEGHSQFAQYDNLLYTPLIAYRAEAYLRLNNVRQALEDYKKAVKLSPYHTYNLANLGTCYHLCGNEKMAKQYYEKSLEVTPGFKSAKNNLLQMKGMEK